MMRIDDDWELDALLLERFMAGEIRVREQIFARHARAIIRFFRNTVGPQELEDLSQETLTRLFAALPSIENGRYLRAFALGIARRVLLEHLRALKRDRRFDPEVDSIADLERGPVSLAVGKQELRLLLAGLRRLPLNLQILLEQHYFEGRSYVELAREAKCSPATIRTRARRARVLLEAEISKLEASGPLIASTIEHLDDWARDLRELLHRAEAEHDDE